MILRALATFAAMHWRWLAGAASVVVGLLTGRDRASEARRLQAQLYADDVRRRVQEIAEQRGAEAAHQVVRTTYAEELGKMDVRWQEKADEFQDPAALAAFLVKASGTSKKPC